MGIYIPGVKLPQDKKISLGCLMRTYASLSDAPPPSSRQTRREVLTMGEPVLKPCPCCGVSRSVNFTEIQHFFSWELTLYCPHRGCDFEATGRGMTRRGAERRAIKRWNEMAEGGADG